MTSLQNNITYNKVERESRGELLRLVCMLMIVMHHFAVHCLYPQILVSATPSNWGDTIVYFTHAFIYVGVNCFVLLSGYYGIKVSLNSFIRLYLFLSFYALLDSIGGGESFAHSIKSAIFPFSAMISFHNGNVYWFLKEYITLYLLAPILNAARVSMEKKVYISACALLLFMQVYFGDIKLLIDAEGGYSLLNFILLYMVGGYIYRFFDINKMQSIRYKSLLIYVVACVIWGLATILKVYHCRIHVPYWHAFAYNNIVVLIASVGFFVFMMSYQFKSKVINWLAVSCLAVYIIQENRLIDYGWFSQGLEYIGITMPGVTLSYWIGISIVFLFTALLFDKIRVVFQYPIEWLLRKICL